MGSPVQDILSRMSRPSLKTLVVVSFCLFEKVFADPIQFPGFSSVQLQKEHKTINKDVSSENLKIGELETFQHGVSGEVFVLDEKTLVVKNFNYDGAGPDAFFLVGTEGTPEKTNESTTAILAHPFQGIHYQYRDQEATILEAALNIQVVLTLPPNMKVSDVKWLSVWCRKFSVDFGNMIFPTEPQVNCGDYSFDFALNSGVISAFRTKGENETDNGKLPESCKSVLTQKCETKMDEECIEENVEECETATETKCANVCGDGDECEEVCEDVPIQTCDNSKNRVCTPIPKETCTNTTTTTCGPDIYTEICTNTTTTNCGPGLINETCTNTTEHNCSPGVFNETAGDNVENGPHQTDLYDTLYGPYQHASYSYLFFPYIQVYKAPNVVRAERNETANKNYAPGYGEAFPYDEPERPLGSHINKPQMPTLIESNSIIEGLKTKDMDYKFLSKVEGCYPMVMPLMSTLSSFFVNLAQAENVDLHQNTSEIDTALQIYEPNFQEYVSNYNLYQITVDWVRLINKAMESSHEYKDCRVRKFFGSIGSYFGVSLKKDFAIAKCDIQQSVPKCWNEYKESIENNTFFPDDQSFPYENMTVESIFFDMEDSTLSVGDYNLTEVLDYNFTDVVYSKLDSLGGVTSTVTEVKDTVYSKLRSGYESVMKSRSSLGLYFDMYSPALETVNKLRSYRKEARQYSVESDDESLAELELENSCNLINSTNVQRCWELFISETFRTVDSDYVNSNLAGMDLTFIAYFTEFQINLSILLSIATAMLFGFKDPLERQLPCLYDIVVNEDLNFDMEGVQNNTSFFQSLVEPLGREQFSSLPVRMLESVLKIISHEQLQPALANVTEAAVEKLSNMIEQGELADKISNRSSDLKKWLMSVNVLRVLEGVVELMKTVLRYRWEFLSGNWPELTLLMDTLVERIEGDQFWNSLGEIMKSVVVDRWNLVNIMVENYIQPSYISLVTSTEWLAQDVEGNLRSLADSIRNSDGAECLWRYWGGIDQGLGEHFVCRKSLEAEGLFHGVYNFFLTTMVYLEPSFKVFESQSLCKMFNLCHENEDRELKDIIQASKVREAFIDIHAPILDVKRALVCRDISINKKYWEYVLF